MKTLLLLLAPVLSVAQPAVLFHETFDSNSRAWIETDKAIINNGVMTLTVPEDGTESLINFFVDEESAFTISVDLTQTAGLTDGPFGLVWGSGESDNMFMITSDQQFITHSGNPGQLKKWKLSSVIKGLGKTNQLKIESAGGIVSFYINNIKVDEQKAFPFFGGWSGIFCLAQMQLVVDNLIVYQNQNVSLPASAKEFTEKENLGSGVNSADNELGPLISADGRKLYFARQNVKENVGGIYDDEDIWVSTLQSNNSWSRAINMGRGVNTSLADNLVAVSADDNTMMFETDDGLAVRHRTASGWSDFELIDIDIKNQSEYFVATLSADGKAIIFSARLKNNLFSNSKRNDVDLFVCTKERTGWSAPVNLGPSVNTIGNDTSPFLSADGKTLYFATNGLPGYGYQDIFFSRRQSSSWTDWSAPVNLGDRVNTPGFDAYYTVPAAGDYAYFVSFAKDGFGMADLYRIKLHEEIKPKPVILVKGVVVDNSSKEPLAASIHFENLDTGEEIGEARSDPKTGMYQIVLPVGFHYGVRAGVPGFYAMHENLDLGNSAKYEEVTQNLYMVKIAIGETVKLNNVFFEAGLPDLKPESYPELDRLVSILTENPGVVIHIEGHTDAKGDPEALLKLSRDRVEAVKQYLVTKNIVAGRISGEGFGASRPIAPSDTEENSRLNRRVEFKIIKQ